jgi:hypothetical protein
MALVVVLDELCSSSLVQVIDLDVSSFAHFAPLQIRPFVVSDPYYPAHWHLRVILAR